MQKQQWCSVLWHASATVVAFGMGTGITFAQRPLDAPWQSTDVGEVGIAGSASETPDADLRIAGAGSDIWGTADSFHFVYQPIYDGEISSNPPSLENTDYYAKVGLMIRQSLDPGSPHVILDIKPDNSVEFMTRSTQGGETTFIAGVPAGPHSWGLTLIRRHGVVTAIICGGTCQTLGSTAFVDGPALTGAVVTSHNPSVLNHAMFPASPPRVTTVPQPWFSFDVGAVGRRGDAFEQNGTFVVRGAGADIWGTSDAFHFVRNCVLDDGEIVARVVSEENADTFGKAGLIMQDHGPTVILDVRPNGLVEFMARPAAGASMVFLAGDALAFPDWLKLVRRGDEFTGYVADEGGSWRMVGSTTVAMHHGSCIEGGLAVTSHDVNALNTSTFDHVSLHSQAFEDVDVGDVGIAGSAWFSSGGIALYGAGDDIWGTADAFNFDARGMFGDGQIVVRVDGMENTHPFAKAGLMIRESTDPSSPHVILDLKPNGDIEFMTRQASGGETAYLSGATAGLQPWLKLERVDSTVNGYTSADGQTWTLVGSTTLLIAPDALAGLIVTSHQRGVLNRSSFSSLGR